MCVHMSDDCYSHVNQYACSYHLAERAMDATDSLNSDVI